MQSGAGRSSTSCEEKKRICRTCRHSSASCAPSFAAGLTEGPSAGGSGAELQPLVERLAERIGRALERQGVLVRDAESSYLELGRETGGPMDDLLGHSITYRVAVGPRAGQKVFSLQTVPAREGERKGVAQYAGFSLHAGIGVEAEQREKLERLTRYVSRPPVAIERLDLTAQGSRPTRRCARRSRREEEGRGHASAPWPRSGRRLKLFG
jgi:hypothetical protein